MPAAYLLWNAAILQFLARRAGNGTVLYLTVTPTILDAVFAEHFSDVPLANDPVTSFTGAVREMYATVVASAGSLHALLSRTSSDEPLATAYVAASVLAAYEMQTDDEASALAYYPRLASLLDVQLHGPYPLFFESETFEALWYDVALWLSEQKIGELALPGSASGRNRFIAYPLTHVPFRCVDTARLPQFFSWARYERGTNIPRDQVEATFTRWSDIHRLTKSGREAFNDGRREAVLAQIALELRAWDGCVEEASGARIATVELHLDIVRNRPAVSYIGRRPRGFPSRFHGHGATFEAGEDGWYDPLRVPHDHGQLLRDGINWESDGNSRLALRRHGSMIIPFAPMEFATGFISRSRLPAGIPCAMLVAEAHVDSVLEYLAGIAAKTPTVMRHPELPEGWALLRDVHVAGDAPSAAALPLVEVDHDLQIVARGGLRIGRRWQWLRGASPQLVVLGGEVQRAHIDGTRVHVLDGVLQTDALEKVGVHVVEVPGLRQRVEIVEPIVSDVCVNVLPTDIRRAVVLPSGAWTLVGRDRRDIVTCSVGAPGALVNPDFDPVWAVGPVTQPIVTIIYLATSFDAPATHDRHSRSGIGLAWANALYAANARRHRFGSFDDIPSAKIVELWKRYLSAAKELKRRVRRTRK